MSSGQKQIHQARIHSNQMFFVMAKQGGWTVVRRWPKTLNSTLILKGNYQDRVHSDQTVLVVDR